MSSVISFLEVLANTIRGIEKYRAQKGNTMLNVSCSYAVPVYCCDRLRKYPDNMVSCKATIHNIVTEMRNTGSVLDKNESRNGMS